MSEVTRLLRAIGEGDASASTRLLPLVYDELRRVARAHMAREGNGHTLQATALVHEVYMRLVDGSPTRWDGRGHFFAAAAEAMRRILVDHARQKLALKRGGARERVPLDGDEVGAIRSPCSDACDLIALDEALDRLAAEDPGKARLIELLYFAGLTLEEAAAALGVSRTEAHRRSVFARAWLFDAIGGG